MPTLSRRSFNQQSLGSLVTFSLLETLFACDAFGKEVQPITARWLNELNGLGLDLRNEALTQVVWQEKVEELFTRADLPELLKFVDFEQLAANAKLVEHGARSLRCSFPKVEGLPTNLVFGKQIFAVKKDRSVVPHGHNNMATAFLVLDGKFEGRHYDRVEDERDHMIIKPTIDRNFGQGECSTVSDYKDNVHWFKASHEPSFLFNIHVLNVRPDSGLKTGRVYVDPNGEKLDGGLVRARRITYGEANRLYG